jgi:hypothetical protein
MRQLSALLIALLPLAAGAECYMRSATVNQLNKSITRIVDVKRSVVPVNQNQFKCNVAFRAEIDHVWHTGEGQSIGANGDSIDQICSQAMDSGRSYLLSKVCRDDALPEVKTVRVGDIVQISELAPHPEKPNFFEYKSTKCRWFVESDFDPVRRDVLQHQGIVCLLRKGEWQVVDKF